MKIITIFAPKKQYYGFKITNNVIFAISSFGNGTDTP